MNRNEPKRIKRPSVIMGALFAAFSLAVLNTPWLFPVTLAVSVIVAAVFAFSMRQDKAIAVTMFVFIVCGAVLPHISYVKNEIPAMKFLEKHTQEVTLSGTVTYFNSSGSYSGFDVKVHEVNGTKLEKPMNVHTYCFSADYAEVGDTLTFTGTPLSVYDSDTEGFDTVSYLRSKRIFIVVPEAVIESSKAALHKGIITPLKNYIDSVYAEYLPRNFDYTTYRVAKALVLGDKELVPDKLEDSFTRSGTLHLLCVSGMHLTVILGFAYFVLRSLTVHKRLSAVIIICICIFYVILTGAQVSVLRAGIMSCITYIAMLLGRKSDGVVSLFVSAAVLCAADPYMVLGIGAQLSFLATLGIVVGIYMSRELFGKNAVISSLFASACAVCFTLPLSAFSFDGVCVFSLFSTLAASPFCDAALILLILLVFVSPLGNVGILSGICVFVAQLCNFMLNAYIKISEFFASFKFSYIPFPQSLNGIIFILCTALMTISVFMYLGQSKGIKIICGAVMGVSVAALAVSLALCVYEDTKCHVYYYRKNASDIQINIKLGSRGTLMINNDNVLCTNDEKLPFDKYSNNNYLVVVPDEKIVPEILCGNIKMFDKRFGIDNVYVAAMEGAEALRKSMESYGIKTTLLNAPMRSGDIMINVAKALYGNGCKVQLVDGEQAVCAVISDNYNVGEFNLPDAVNAFFTSQTKNQFNADKDKLPKGKMFYARLKKGEEADGVNNIFGINSICIY